MAHWPGKYVIGLTGNIATGKSVVRRMLEHLGAYGIDADALSHRAIAQGAPGYQEVIRLFGAWVLDDDGQINRARLGRIVFSDPAALKGLEGIIHPLVRQAVDFLARRASQDVIVIEAIKLLEGDLRNVCDAIWVTYADPQVQLARLVNKRRMLEADARQRIAAQPAQKIKLDAANIIITNNSGYEEAWRQVTDAWQRTVPGKGFEPPAPTIPKGQLSVIKAGPKQAGQIAEFINKVALPATPLTRLDVMEAFGEKAYTILQRDGVITGLVGWQVENLVARISEFLISDAVTIEEAARLLLADVERASSDLQCEAALLFLPPELAANQTLWTELGYGPRSLESLAVRAWQDAARESMPTGTELLFRQLRKDRVLRPV